MAKKDETKTVQIPAIFDGDTKKYHRFAIVDDRIVGSVYILKSEIENINQINIDLLTKADKDYAGLKEILDRRKDR